MPSMQFGYKETVKEQAQDCRAILFAAGRETCSFLHSSHDPHHRHRHRHHLFDPETLTLAYRLP